MTSHQTVDGIELDHIYLFVNVAMIYHLASLLLIHKEYFMMFYYSLTIAFLLCHRIIFKSEENQMVLNQLIKEVKGCNPSFQNDHIHGKFIPLGIN